MDPFAQCRGGAGCERERRTVPGALGEQRGLDDGHDAVCDAARLACQGAPVPGRPASRRQGRRRDRSCGGRDRHRLDGLQRTRHHRRRRPRGQRPVPERPPDARSALAIAWMRSSPPWRRGRPPGTTSGIGPRQAARCRSQTKRESRGRSAIASTARRTCATNGDKHQALDFARMMALPRNGHATKRDVRGGRTTRGAREGPPHPRKSCASRSPGANRTGATDIQ